MKSNVVIVGGGWAGISAALNAIVQGHCVTLLEASPALGGRARRVPFKDQYVDNGQHLLLGAYPYTLKLLDILSLSHPHLFLRQPLSLNMHSKERRMTLRLPNIPSPFHALLGLLRLKGLGKRACWQALKFCRQLHQQHYHIAQDCTVEALLHQANQGADIRSFLWEPLCLAALTTPAQYASARIFLSVLKQAFSQSAQDSDLLFARKDLSRLLPLPAKHFIEQNGGRVLTSHRVDRLSISNEKCQGVFVKELFVKGDEIILALPPRAVERLVPPHPKLKALKEQCAQFSYEAITTVYLQYSKSVHLPHPMMGMVGTQGHWVFDRRFAHQPGLLSVIISGNKAHSQIALDRLTQNIALELHHLWPQVPSQPLESKIIREKFAAFSCRENIDSIRPKAETPLQGLWIAGDYTQTDLPATLEGAVKSGFTAVNDMINRCINEKNPQPG